MSLATAEPRARAGRIRLLLASQPLDYGVPRVLLDLVRFVDPARYEIDVACPRGSALWSGVQGHPGVRLHAIAGAREISPVDVLTLARLLPLAKRADVIHAHSSKAGFLTRLAAAMQGRGRRVIFSPHGWSFWSADGVKAGAYRSLERVAARWCGAIVTVSHHERRAGLDAHIGRPGQYHVVHNGVELERFARGYAPIEGRVLFIGRLAPPKRPDLVIRAVSQLRTRYPRLHFWIVGDGPERGAIDRLVVDLGLEDVVRVLGARDDVPELLSRATALVLASEYEGCPLSILEAMAAGVPVIATSVGGIPELVEHGRTGLLVEAGQPEALAAAIGELLSDPDRARRMGTAAREVARERFSIARMAKEILALYDDARARGPS